MGISDSNSQNNWWRNQSERDCFHAINTKPDHVSSYCKLLTLYKKHHQVDKMLHLMAYINQKFLPLLKVRFSKSHSGFSLIQKHVFAKEAHNHIMRNLYPESIGKGERVLSYWLVEFIWDRFIKGEIRQLPGKWTYGYGYILLSDKNAYFVNLGQITEKVFTPATHKCVIFPNEPQSEDMETNTFIKRIGYQELQFANNNFCQPIIDDKVWSFHNLTDYEEDIAFLVAFKAGYYGNIEK